MNLKEKIENHAVILFLGALLAGFSAGIVTLEKINEWRGITQDKIESLERENQELKKDLEKEKTNVALMQQKTGESASDNKTKIEENKKNNQVESNVTTNLRGKIFISIFLIAGCVVACLMTTGDIYISIGITVIIAAIWLLI